MIYTSSFTLVLDQNPENWKVLIKKYKNKTLFSGINFGSIFTVMSKRLKKENVCTLICIITILCKTTSLSSLRSFLYNFLNWSIVKRNMIWWLWLCVKKKRRKKEQKKRNKFLKKEKLCAFFPYFFFLREKQNKKHEKRNKTKFVSMFSVWYQKFTLNMT